MYSFIFLILCFQRVASSPGELIRLKEHFIASDIEENRRFYSSSYLTVDIERGISLKIEKSELNLKKFLLSLTPNPFPVDVHHHVRPLVRV